MRAYIYNCIDIAKYIIVSIMSGLVGFVFVPLLAKQLTPESFAEFSKAQLLAQVILTPSVFGITAYMTAVFERRGDSHEFSSAFVELTQMQLIVGLVVAAYGIATSNMIILVLVALASYARFWQLVGSQLFRLQGNIGGFFVYQVILPIAFFTCSLFAYNTLIKSGYLLYIISSVIYGIFAYYAYIRVRRIGWIVNLISLRVRNTGFRTFAVGSFLHSVAGVVLTTWDKGYVASKLDSTQFASYVLSAQFASGLVLILSAITQAVSPKYYSILARSQRRTLDALKFQILMVLIYIAIFIAYLEIIPVAVNYLNYQEYQDLVRISKLLCTSALLQGIYFLSSAAIFYYERTFALAIITASCGLIGVGCTMLIGISSVYAVGLASLLTWSVFCVASSAFSLYLISKNV